MKKIKDILTSSRGSIVFESPVMVVLVVMVLMLFLTVAPAFIDKQQLDVYASELLRTAELSGQVGDETSEMESKLNDRTGLEPRVSWSKTGKIQLGEEIIVTCTIQKDLGFGNLGSFPVTLQSRQTGRSEVYWK